MKLSVSSLEKEGQYQGSKYLKVPFLVDGESLRNFFDFISPFSLFGLTQISDGEELSIDAFLEAYGFWIEELQKGSQPDEKSLKLFLAAALTNEKDSLWLQEIPEKRYLIRMKKPCIHVEAHYFTYSKEDQVFRSMTMGPHAIFWGLQFSFPQIYQDPKTMDFLEVKNGVNFEIFKKIRLWVRSHTRATPFHVEKRRSNASFRIGRECFSWINNHPGLIKEGIQVDGA